MKTLLILSILLLSSCATDQSREYDRARAAANPNYQDASNESTTPSQSVEDPRAGIKRGNLFACLLRYSAYFNQADARFICNQ